MNVPSRLPYACVALLIASCAAAQQQGPKPGSGSAKTLKQAAIPQCSNGGVGSNCFVLLGPKNDKTVAADAAIRTLRYRQQLFCPSGPQE